jgi:hypothetical protein
MTWNDYYYGSHPASIQAKNIIPSCYQQMVHLTASTMNNAFDIYYRGHQAARQLTQAIAGMKVSPEARKAREDLKSKIQTDLRAAADARSIFAIGKSLSTSFEHLAKNNGFWRDDDWNGNYKCNVPSGIIAFLGEVEKRGSMIANSRSEWNSWQRNLQNWNGNAKWEGLGAQLDRGQQVVDKIGDKIWVTLGASEKAASGYTAHVSKWIGYGSKVKGFADAYLRVKAAGDKAQRQLVAEAAAFVVNDLPFFGGAYADVIRGVPKMMSFFEDAVIARNRAVDGKF